MGKFKKVPCLIKIIMVIIGITAAGFFLWKTGQIFIQMVSKDHVQDTANTQETQEEILVLSKLEFWTCQTGVYQNRGNAEAAVTNLGNKGWKAGIIEEKNDIVSVGMTSTKEEGAEISKKLEQNGVSNWTKKVEYPALHFKVTGKDIGTTIQMLKLANELLAKRDLNNPEVSRYTAVLSAEKCPGDLVKIRQIIQEIRQEQDPNGQASAVKPDSRKLFQLFNEYKDITTKYFNHNDQFSKK